MTYDPSKMHYKSHRHEITFSFKLDMDFISDMLKQALKIDHITHPEKMVYDPSKLHYKKDTFTSFGYGLTEMNSKLLDTSLKIKHMNDMWMRMYRSRPVILTTI